MLRAAAVAVAVIAVFMGVMYLRFSGEDNDDDRSQGSTVSLVVATQDIPAGTQISEGMVRVDDVPEREVVAGAFSGNQPLVGWVTRAEILAGEQIIDFKVIPPPGIPDTTAFCCPPEWYLPEGPLPTSGPLVP